MNDRAVSLLEQYEIEVQRTRKGRGAILCDTNQGCLILKKYIGSEEKLSMQNRLLCHIRDIGKVQAEQIVPTKEGTLFVRDGDGIPYILKTYQQGRECNIYEKTEYLEAVKLLAKLHQCMELPYEENKSYTIFYPEKEYEKHNRELKKIRKYLKQKGQKTWFEIRLSGTFDLFLQQALDVTQEWNYYHDIHKKWQIGDKITCCHGDYQYHNIIRSEDGWFLVNFEKCIYDDPIRDLYLFLRKLLEKSNWSVPLGKEILEAYTRERKITAMSWIDLYYRLSYPEKFWKIVNFYYNSGKAWIPERNLEKLEKLLQQEQNKQIFLETVFGDVIGT